MENKQPKVKEVKKRPKVEFIDSPPMPFEYMKATPQDKSIALKRCRAVETFETSYVIDNHDERTGRYTSEKNMEELFYDSLTAKERNSGFAVMLYEFSRWSNDLTSICNRVLGFKYPFEKIQAHRKELWGDDESPNNLSETP